MSASASSSARKKAPSSSPPTASARNGTSPARTSAAGRCITSKARPSIRTASTPRKPAAGSARSSSAPTTAAKPGSSPARRPAKPTTTPDGMPKGESNKFVYDTEPPDRQAAHHAPVVRRHAASVGIQTRLAPRAVAHRSRHRLRRRRRCRALQIHRRRHNLARARRPPRPRHRPAMVARRRRHGPAHDPARSARIPTASSSPSPPPARSAPTTAAKPGSRSTAASARNTSPIPTPKSATASTASPCTRRGPTRSSCKSTGTCMRTDNAGDQWHEVSGNLPTDFGFPIEVHAHEPETIYVVPITSDSLALPARRQAPRLPQPHRRQRLGAAHQRPAARELLRQRPARRDVVRLARPVRHLLRHHRRPGLLLRRLRRQLDRHRPRPAGGVIGRGANNRLTGTDRSPQRKQGSTTTNANQPIRRSSPTSSPGQPTALGFPATSVAGSKRITMESNAPNRKLEVRVPCVEWPKMRLN